MNKNNHIIEAQFDILRRITTRGRSMFLERRDNVGIDMFEHLETEIERLRLMIYDYRITA